MKELIYRLMENTGTLTVKEVFINISVSCIFGIIIYISYIIAHKRTIYSKKFNITLIMLTVMTATVMTVVGNNITLSLGMVGALSIVRFRTAIKDSRDTAYIFWTIIVGICCGVGDFMVASIGSSFIFILMLILGNVRNDDRVLLIIRGSRTGELKIEAIVFQVFSQKADLKVKNTTKDTIEYIYELNKQILNKASLKEKSIIQKFYDSESVDYVNIVRQSDDIGN